MPSLPQIVRTRAALAAALEPWRRAGETHALVPTMGALHEGHLALVRLAQQHCRRVVASIFVNPTQFAPTEDLGRYPRDEAGDLGKLATAGCDLVWAPEQPEMYPPGFATKIVPGGAALGLEADFRPAFLAGVATVCCKLFTQVAPKVAVFGEKDFQQLAVVRQIVRDLDLPLAIVGAPTIREPDGLAMSSRNRYLSADERKRAPLIHAAITDVARQVAAGGDGAEACREALASLVEGGFRPDYVELRDAVTLAPASSTGAGSLRVLAAAWLGKTRLIDNVATV
jgi:pantoate--beta-alanine ligase